MKYDTHVSYFEKHYGAFRFSVATEVAEGFRPAQLAAIQAVCGHVYQSRHPAIVTMPTGSGKTAVILALCFALRATRVLVLTPSRLVREQIHLNFATLGDLKLANAVPQNLSPPKTFVTSKSIGSDEEWRAPSQYDVVVATVPSVSSRAGRIPLPPKDLFDLVLVDEAHHAPAATWKVLLDQLSGATQVLFTATPYRRDEKLLPGRMVFTYNLERAQADKIFGDLHFEAISTPSTAAADLAIAKAAERRLKSDRTKGFEHLLMVRTDSVKRAKELRKLYDANTKLRLDFVHGQHGMRHVRTVIERLRSGQSDGIICVNMFGEGFNLPNLKIAAIHAPHKSLAVTLQFVGRFARTSAEKIGRATFIAEEQSGSRELGDLFNADAAWSQLIANLSSDRVTEELRLRETLETFKLDASPDVEGLSLSALRPYFHVRVYKVNDANLDMEPSFADGTEILFKARSPALGVATYITRDISRSRWSVDDRFLNVQFDLHVVCHFAESKLLFIATSDRKSDVYDKINAAVAGTGLRKLSSPEVNRVLNGLNDPVFFNIGMRNRTRNGVIESYRMLSGPDTGGAVGVHDGRSYDRGHFFAKGAIDAEAVTLGASATSKVWSNRADQLPYLIDWCAWIAANIASGVLKPTGSAIDHLSAGEHLEQLPAGVIAALWPPGIYRDPPNVVDEATGEHLGTLLDADLEVTGSAEGTVSFSVQFADRVWRATFALDTDMLITAEPDNLFSVELGRRRVPLDQFLSDRLPVFFTDKFASVVGHTLYPDLEALQPFDVANASTIQWAAAGVNIEEEKPKLGIRSIFDWIGEVLTESDRTFVYCDDAAGEITDFLAVSWRDARPVLELYHCKASSSAKAGARVEDLYDVCGQVVRTAPWMNPDKIMEHVVRRAKSRPERFIKGTASDLSQAFAREHRALLSFELTVIQPGISRKAIAGNVAELLAAANAYVVAAGFLPLKLICSD